MTDYIRNLPVKIVTVPVSEKTITKSFGVKIVHHPTVGWKVYINGAKHPEKPVEFYPNSETVAIDLAIHEYHKKYFGV